MFLWARRATTLALVAIPLLAASPQAIAQSLLENPSFENGLDSWDPWDGATDVDASAPKSGANALMIPPSGGSRAQNVTARVQPGQTYQLSVFAKIGASSENATVGYKVMDSAGREVAHRYMAVASRDYRKMVMSFVTPKDAATVFIYVWKRQGSASAHFDDFELLTAADANKPRVFAARPAPAPAPEPPPVAEPAAIAYDGPSLKALAAPRGILMGAAVQSKPLTEDPRYARIVVANYDLIVPDWEFKFKFLQPARGVYDFKAADKIMDFAKANGLKVKGHALVWYLDLPNWLKQAENSPEELRAILEDHIRTVMTHFRDKYPGVIYGWDVVNEAIADDFEAQIGMRKTIWTKIGATPDEHVRLAFKWAREVDPNIKLFYNEYGNEAVEAKDGKAMRVLDYLARWKKAGVPIDALGLQTHVKNYEYLDPRRIVETIRRAAALGLEVHISEMDVPLKSKSEFEDQADTYWRIMDACVESAACKGFVTWGFTDRHSWIPNWLPGGWSYGHPFDADYNPKPALYAMIRSLGGAKAPPIKAPGKVEVEYMAMKTVGARMDVGWMLWSEGAIEDVVAFEKAGDYEFRVVAKGQPAGGVWPVVEVRVDGAAMGRVTVNSGDYATFDLRGKVKAAGERKLTMRYVNDGKIGSEDRNVWIDKIYVEGR